MSLSRLHRADAQSAAPGRKRNRGKRGTFRGFMLRCGKWLRSVTHVTFRVGGWRDAAAAQTVVSPLNFSGTAMTLKRSAWLIAPVLLTGFLGWRALVPDPADAADPQPPPPIPVQTAQARIEDVPVYFDGLGTVQPLNIVQVKAQVNGTLIALPVREGAEVHQGDIVAEIDPRPYKAALDQTLAQRDEDAALLKSAQQDLQRYQNLAKSSFAPKQQVDDQQATVDKQIGAVGVDSAQVETARINLDYCVIRAPFDGRVSFYQLNVGNLVQVASQTGIVSIVQDKPISVVLTLPEADLQQVRDAASKGQVPIAAFDGTGKTQLASGFLMTPNNTIDTTTGTISLKGTFPNLDDHLWPGQFVNARVQVGTIHHAVTVPELAVGHGPDGTFVYTIKPDGTAAQTNVTVGEQVADRTVVASGLSGTEIVVVSGQSRLAPGAHVKSTGQAAASS
jgi:membrane fusion protein, multidrug efflux system